MRCTTACACGLSLLCQQCLASLCAGHARVSRDGRLVLCAACADDAERARPAARREAHADSPWSSVPLE